MTDHRISGTVTHTVVLGTRTHGGTLTVTSSGNIAPIAFGADGVRGFVAGAKLTNHGTITGGVGRYGSTTNGGDGGIGVDLAAGGIVRNTGSITGGVGGSAAAYLTGGAGGAGLYSASGGDIHNAGFIGGGTGGAGGYRGTAGDGGNGVDLAGGKLTNSGTIHGGAGGGYVTRKTYVVGGNGGIGVVITNAGTFLNSGVVQGGDAGFGGYPRYYGGVAGLGVNVLAGGMLSNSGTILGGQFVATTGVGLASDTKLINSGLIVGGYTDLNQGNGGDGVIGVGTITNLGTIDGGTGHESLLNETGYYIAGNGGDGVILEGGGMLSNAGTIAGGTGIYALFVSGGIGGVGIDLQAGATLGNTGLVSGGVGGSAYSYNASQGGVGISLAASARLHNTGIISGGAGGASKYYHGGTGGTGVDMAAGANFTNQGNVAGGNGGDAASATRGVGGNGGTGVYIDGGTLTNLGTISGGAGGTGALANGMPGEAIQFGPVASTLVAGPGAVFVGQVAANAGVLDVLDLVGAGGVLTGLGTQFTGFGNIDVSAGATWTLGQVNTLAAGASLLDSGVLTVAGMLSGAGGVTIESGGSLYVQGSLTVASVAFASGRGETLSIAAASSVTSSLAGFGAGDVIDVAKVATSMSFIGGTLTLENGNKAVETLAFTGSYSPGNFTLKSDGRGGTTIDFVAANGSRPSVDFMPRGLSFGVDKPLLAVAGRAWSSVSDPERALDHGLVMTHGHFVSYTSVP